MSWTLLLGTSAAITGRVPEDGNSNWKGGAYANLTFDMDLSSMFLHNSVAHGKPEASPLCVPPFCGLLFVVKKGS